MREVFKRKWPGNLQAVPAIIEAIQTQMTVFGFEAGKVMQICLAAEEVVVNIVRHGYKQKPQTEIEVSVKKHPDQITIQFIDQGIPFNPILSKDPDINQALNERQIGGLGIFLVKKIVDEISYQRVDNSNCLVLKLNL